MKKYGLLLYFTLFLGGCSSSRYLPKPMNFKQHVKGLYLQTKIDGKVKILGEIIEVNPKEIKILPVNRAGRILTIPKEKIKKAKILLSTTSNYPDSIMTWAALINLCSIGHGFLAFSTLPINLYATFLIGKRVFKDKYRIKYPEKIRWNEIKKFARFPQGIPHGIDPNSIK